MEVETRDESASCLVYDWSTSTNCGMNMPFLHLSKSFNQPARCRISVNELPHTPYLLYMYLRKLPRELPR